MSKLGIKMGVCRSGCSFAWSTSVAEMEEISIQLISIHEICTLWDKISGQFTFGEKFWTRTESSFDKKLAWCFKKKKDGKITLSLENKDSQIGAVFFTATLS